MAEKTEGRYRGEFLYSEACGTRSLETVTIDTGDLAAGTVVAQLLAATSVAGTNTGNGVMGAVTVGSKVEAGAYLLKCIAAATNAGTFAVYTPSGARLADLTVAVAYTGNHLNMTLADGATDFVVNDSFTITVAAGKYVALNVAGTDGSQIASGILYDNVDATAADVEAVVYVRDCEVNGNEITWPGSITAPQKAAAIAQLATLGIIVR